MFSIASIICCNHSLVNSLVTSDNSVSLLILVVLSHLDSPLPSPSSCLQKTFSHFLLSVTGRRVSPAKLLICLLLFLPICFNELIHCFLSTFFHFLLFPFFRLRSKNRQLMTRRKKRESGHKQLSTVTSPVCCDWNTLHTANTVWCLPV